MAMDDDDKPWDPKDELDPVKVQAEGITLMKRFMAKAEKQEKDEEDRKKREEEYARAPAALGRVHSFPRTPTLAEVANRMKRAWDEVQRVGAGAPVEIQVEMFRMLATSYTAESAAAEEPLEGLPAGPLAEPAVGGESEGPLAGPPCEDPTLI